MAVGIDKRKGIDGETVLRRSAAPIETTVGSEVVLMTLASGKCFGLGTTGSDVWRGLATPTRLTPLVEALRVEYDAPADVIERDVKELLEHLLDEGLIEVS